MLRPADLAAASVQRLTTALPVWNTETRSNASMLEAGSAARIAGEVSFEARGLSVEDHTRRVLSHLVVERDVP